MSLQKQKREEEIKRHRVKMNLDEIKSELNKLEGKLSELKNQKHQLFSQLKKVLHEDDLRKRQWNANNDLFTAQHLGLAQQMQLAGAANPLFAPHIQQAFTAPTNAPSLQFYSSNGQPIARPNPPPGQYQPKFTPHLVQQKGQPMTGPPPPPPSITAGTGVQRTLKRTHEESVAPPRGQRGVSPPVQTPTRHLDYKSVPVTYTPSIPSDSRHPSFPVIHSQHWTHPRHPYAWPPQ